MKKRKARQAVKQAGWFKGVALKKKRVQGQGELLVCVLGEGVGDGRSE